MASDLISREALIEELKEDVEFESPTFTQCVNSAMSSAFRIAVKRVKAAPSVDAVEVVRCKDCFKRNDPSRCPMCYDEWYYDDDDGSDFIRQDNTIDDGFCHVGAMMDGGKT